jgi:hypothetical protein
MTLKFFQIKCIDINASSVSIRKHLSRHFAIQNDIKHGDALSPLGLKLNGTELMAYSHHLHKP